MRHSPTCLRGRSRGAGSPSAEARHVGPDGVVAEIRASGLRGRGGAGYPTALKWGGILEEAPSRCYVVCNAAEGEPGTFKDRALIRANPYQLLEGIAVAAETIGAVEAYVGIKARFRPEIERLEMAATEMASAGLLGEVPVRIVEGPDDYLFGEEKGPPRGHRGKRSAPPVGASVHRGALRRSGLGRPGGGQQRRDAEQHPTDHA